MPEYLRVSERALEAWGGCHQQQELGCVGCVLQVAILLRHCQRRRQQWQALTRRAVNRMLVSI